MRTFHVSIHARSVEAMPNARVVIDGRMYAALFVPCERTAATFDTSFEAAAGALAALPRMYIEADGSFVWVSSASAGRTPWQLDGVLYDRGGRLLFVDLKGACTAEAFDQLLMALGWPATPIMIQLVREAVFLDETEFRKYAFEDNDE